MSNLNNSVRYVKNTNGGATKEIFIEDFEPIGEMLWRDMVASEYVREDENGRIFLTDKGAAFDAA